MVIDDKNWVCKTTDEKLENLQTNLRNLFNFTNGLADELSRANAKIAELEKPSAPRGRSSPA